MRAKRRIKIGRALTIISSWVMGVRNESEDFAIQYIADELSGILIFYLLRIKSLPMPVEVARTPRQPKLYHAVQRRMTANTSSTTSNSFVLIIFENPCRPIVRRESQVSTIAIWLMRC